MYGKRAIVGLLALVFCAMFVMGGASALTIEKSNYTCMPGQTVSIEVTIPNGTYNTSASDWYSIGYEYINSSEPGELAASQNFAPTPEYTTWYTLTDAQVEDISDYDSDTFLNLSYAGDSAGLDYFLIMDTDLDNYGSMQFKLDTPIDSFDGVMMKKSFNLDVFRISVMNTTYGYYSECMLANDDMDDDIEFADSVNSSYKFVGGVDDGFEFLTFADYVDEYGMIDNVTLYFDNYYSFTQSEEDLLYEFHLFNADVGIGSVVIASEDLTYMAWGTDSNQVTASTWIVDINVPSTAAYGAYAVLITDTTGASDMTTLTVEKSQYNIWTLGWFLFFAGMAVVFGVASAKLENSGKDTLAVAATAIAAVVMVIVAGFILADIMGWTHIGILPAGFALPAILSKVRKPKNIGHGKKVAVALMFVGMLIIGCAFVGAATYTVSSDKTSVKPGDSFTVTVYDTTAHLNKTVLTGLIQVKKLDEETPYFVHWSKLVTVATDKESATVRFTTPDSVSPGTYDVIMGECGSVTIYVKAATQINWMVFGLFICIGGVILVAGGLYAMKTKTRWDDVLVILIGLGFVVMALLYYFGVFIL